MRTSIKAVVVAGAVTIGGGVFGLTNAGAQQAGPEQREDQAEGPDVPIVGDDLDRASAAALDHLGEGRVTGTEVDDEESYYEVEVTLNNNREVDVQLDEDFNVVGLD